MFICCWNVAKYKGKVHKLKIERSVLSYKVMTALKPINRISWISLVFFVYMLL